MVVNNKYFSLNFGTLKLFGGLHGNLFKLIRDTEVIFVSQMFIILGMSVMELNGEECETAGRARMEMARKVVQWFLLVNPYLGLCVW